jgi:uncharacterized protein
MMQDTTARRGDWGCTFTGRQYWPEDPRPEDIDIEDIAHALAHQCRFGGHCREFYSVAQHSVLVSEACPPEHALWGLLHDASEAYLVDVPRPAKRAMPEYVRMEAAMMAAVCKRFGLSAEMPAAVKLADEATLAAEARDLMPPASVARWCLPVAPVVTAPIRPLSPADAKGLFLHRFSVLVSAPWAA